MKFTVLALCAIRVTYDSYSYVILILARNAANELHASYNFYAKLNFHFFSKINKTEVGRNLSLKVLTKEKQNLLNNFREYLQNKDGIQMINFSALIIYPIWMNSGSDL